MKRSTNISGGISPSARTSTPIYVKPKRIVESAISPMITGAYSRISPIFLRDLKPLKNVNRVGYWEIDTVMGLRDHHCIFTLVERKQGFTLVGKLKNKTKKETNACLLRSIRVHWKKIKTTTSDDGTEFHN